MLEENFFVAGIIIVDVVQGKREDRSRIMGITSHLSSWNRKRTGNEDFRGGRQQLRKFWRNERLLERYVYG